MSMINARGTTNGSAYAMWSVMLYGTCKQTDHGCTSCPTSMLSLRSQPLSSALLLKNKPREQHECTNLMHSDLGYRGALEACDTYLITWTVSRLTSSQSISYPRPGFSGA